MRLRALGQGLQDAATRTAAQTAAATGAGAVGAYTVKTLRTLVASVRFAALICLLITLYKVVPHEFGLRRTARAV